MNAAFGHVNIIARDWRRLAAFYESVFGCVSLPPERDLSGPLLDATTGVRNARIRGVHLRLPSGRPTGRGLDAGGQNVAAAGQNVTATGRNAAAAGQNVAPAGPTLEIFEYTPAGPEAERAIHSRGFGHIAFVVDDVQAALAEVLAAGGGQYGELVALPVAGAGVVTVVYATDPEGNVIELQSWSARG